VAGLEQGGPLDKTSLWRASRQNADRQISFL